MEARPVSGYREMAPPPSLALYVERLWVQRIGDGDGPYTQPVLPDGRIDIVAVGDHVLLAGPATRTTTLHLAPGEVTVGVRFRPCTAPALVGPSAAELRDADLPLSQLWGQAGTALATRVVDESDWRSRLHLLVDALMQRLDDARPVDPVGVEVVAALSERPGRPLTDLAGDIGLSERQLRRRVEHAVGYPPRTLARVLRFQRFLRAARAAGPGRHLAALAADAGYADQAHLTRESRELSGLPPAALLDWEADRLAG